MAGHMQERGPKTWRLSVYVGRDSRTGRKRYAQRTVHGTKREAERALARLVTEVDEGRHSASAAGTFRQSPRPLAGDQGPVCRSRDHRQLSVGDREVHSRPPLGGPALASLKACRHRLLLRAACRAAWRARQAAVAEDTDLPPASRTHGYAACR